MTGAYTKPERSTERAIGRRILAKVYADPCAFCTHRQVAFGKATCPTFGRVFPRCTSTPGHQFELDQSCLQGATTHAPSK